jgi:hypothetical protein
MKDAPLGFNPNNIVVIELPQGEQATAGDAYLKNVLSTEPGIQKLSFCGDHALPGQYPDKDGYMYLENGVRVKRVVDDVSVDPDYLDLLQIPVIKANGSMPPKKVNRRMR